MAAWPQLQSGQPAGVKPLSSVNTKAMPRALWPAVSKNLRNFSPGAVPSLTGRRDLPDSRQLNPGFNPRRRIATANGSTFAQSSGESNRAGTGTDVAVLLATCMT